MATKQIHRAQAVIECKVCDKGNSIEWKCVTCGEIMCTSCKIFHLRSKALRNHKVLHINDVDERLDAEPSGEEIAVHCAIHPHEEVHMFCEPCDELVCLDCIGGKHKGHTFVKISTILMQKKTELRRYIEKAQEKVSANKQLQQAVHSKMKLYAAERTKNFALLRKHGTHLKSTIDAAMQMMEKELLQRESEDQIKFDHSSEDLEKVISTIQTFIQACENKMSSPSKEMIQFVSKAKADFLKLKDQTLTEVLPPPVYEPGNTEEKEIKNLLGSLNLRHTARKTLKSQQKPSVRILSSFKTENVVTRISCEDDKTLWIGHLKDTNISLVTIDGRVIKKLELGFKLNDFKVHTFGDLWLTEYHGCIVKKSLKKSNRITDIRDVSPFYTYGLDVTRSGDVIIGLCDAAGSKQSKIVRMSPKGIILQSLHYASDSKSPLFGCPIGAMQMKNGKLCVLNYQWDASRCVMCVDWSGNIEFKYTGLDEETKESNLDVAITDAKNNFIVTDIKNKKITLLDDGGHFKQYLLTKEMGFPNPRGLHIDKSGHLWVSDFQQQIIYKVTYLD